MHDSKPEVTIEFKVNLHINYTDDDGNPDTDTLTAYAKDTITEGHNPYSFTEEEVEENCRPQLEEEVNRLYGDTRGGVTWKVAEVVEVLPA